MNFYAIIIGTEILNGRRSDKHFEFLKNELSLYGHELFASFVIKDDEELMRKTFEFVKSDKDAVIFSFGGIGSTPDDLTRAISAEVFTQQPLERHTQFLNDILERFKEEAYPHRIFMSDLPKGASLLFNPINNMSGYSLENRYFFVPGFPQMAHPMLRDVIKTYFSQSKEKYRFTLLATTSENQLITLMQELPKHIELSSLPMIKEEGIFVELSLSGYDKDEVKKYFQGFCDALDKKTIDYKII